MASAGVRTTPSGRCKVWWRLDDGSQGSQTWLTREQARDFKHDLLARVTRGTWVDPRLGKQTFESWARDWWEGWSADPDLLDPQVDGNSMLKPWSRHRDRRRTCEGGSVKLS